MKKTPVFLIVFIVILSAGIIIYKYKKVSFKDNRADLTPQNNVQVGNSGFKTFQSSDVLDFTIQAPHRYSILENLGRVTLETSDGKIIIERVGTNFENLKDFLNDLDSKNITEVEEKLSMMINGGEAVLRTVRKNRGGHERIYWIYKEGWVYSLFTNIQSLYGDLDQIAQSFRYTP